MTRIVFHGKNAACFSSGFADLLPGADVTLLPDRLGTAAERQAYSQAEIIVSAVFDSSLPIPENLRLFHVPGAGYDAVDLDLLPAGVRVCNCFGHEQAIAEYVFAAILARHVPLGDADRQLRAGHWRYQSGDLSRLHDSLVGKTVGLLGFGHIGQAVAKRARAFEMAVVVANRSVLGDHPLLDRAVTLDQLDQFWGEADFIVVSLPLTAQTRGIVDATAFAAMRPKAVIVNVGRGPLIEEQALFEALSSRRIAGAVIDTWYAYPADAQSPCLPSRYPFQELDNIVMTPHMSGWTGATVRARQRVIVENINRCLAGRAGLHPIR